MKNQFSDIYNLVFILVLPLQFIIFCEIKLLLSHSSIQKKVARGRRSVGGKHRKDIGMKKVNGK